MAKHHPGLDLSGLAMDNIKKELMSSEATMENVMEEATDIAKGMKEATVITPTDPVCNKQQSFFFFFSDFFSLQGKNNISLWVRCFGQLNNSFIDDR